MENVFTVIGCIIAVLCFLAIPGLIITFRKSLSKQFMLVEERDEVVHELNHFCQEASFAQLLARKARSIGSKALNTRFIEIPSFKNATWISPEGISMLTARAKYIARKGRACKAINGYRRLLKERAEGLLKQDQYFVKLVNLYNEYLESRAIGYALA